ncbi:MAG: hypothetical protein H6Q20_2553 [Bacteroidetes bacterium]|nr:hypothetical protein [Bacteroidota bacterium]
MRTKTIFLLVVNLIFSLTYAQTTNEAKKLLPGSDSIPSASKSAKGQDFNSARSNKEKASISSSQDFNTTRSNKDKAAISTAQDFNTTRSNRENRFASSGGSGPVVEIGLSPTFALAVGGDNNSSSGLYNGNSYGSKLDFRFFAGKVGLVLTNGFSVLKPDMDAVNANMAAWSSNGVLSARTTDGNQTFLMVGPAVQLGSKVRFIASAQAGLFINNPVNVQIIATEGTRTLMSVTGNNQKYQPGYSGSVSLAFPVSGIFSLGLGVDYVNTQTSNSYSDVKHIEVVTQKSNTNYIGFALSVGVRLPTGCPGN